MDKFMNIWYVDTELVECLCNQILQNVTGITERKNVEQSFSSKIQSKLKNLGIIGVSGEAGINVSRNVTVEEKIEPSIERKIKNILEEIGNNSIPFNEVLKFEDGNKLVFINGYFALYELYYKEKPEKNILQDYKKVDKAKNLVWHFKFLEKYVMPIGFSRKRHDVKAIHYDISNTDFEKEKFDVDIYADGKKVITEIKHLTNNIEYMRPFRFEILGWLEYICENKFSLKPIVILR